MMCELMITGLITKLVNDFNRYSELVALNYEQQKEGKIDEGTLQWNRGSLDKIEEHLSMIAEAAGVPLYWKFGAHDFGFDDWKRALSYRTVEVKWGK